VDTGGLFCFVAGLDCLRGFSEGKRGLSGGMTSKRQGQTQIPFGNDKQEGDKQKSNTQEADREGADQEGAAAFRRRG
jgi:hypothetical protein